MRGGEEQRRGQERVVGELLVFGDELASLRMDDWGAEVFEVDELRLVRRRWAGVVRSFGGGLEEEGGEGDERKRARECEVTREVDALRARD